MFLQVITAERRFQVQVML